jgi:RimJ/RimL family protein N-acetyltransferase
VLTIRPIEDDDLETLFGFQADPDSCRMAAFPPRTREAYFAHTAKIRTNHSNIIRIISVDKTIVGNILSWEMDGKRMVGYWIGQQFWGKGYAGHALKLLLQEIEMRPLFAVVNGANLASKHILEKSGFVQTSSEPIDDPDFGTIQLLNYRLG